MGDKVETATQKLIAWARAEYNEGMAGGVISPGTVKDLADALEAASTHPVIETAELREKAFTAYADLGMGKGGCPQAYTVVRLDDAEAAVAAAERRGADVRQEEIANALELRAREYLPQIEDAELRQIVEHFCTNVVADLRSRSEGGTQE